eukprot:Blabericola_migrator_1__13294@NODE_930_length_5997_cov_288_044013_g646_i0_p3_GENE_NODE_930_length_5997_cov_288_044013_g646_i0NODE_930_length_5997_cov_288_044013_g646_i0_p3_ORF_typecomplete_len172_score14_37DUF2039/PF10217_9/1_3_NODE_930_length_5997_cov_288_044013_g646_i048805395
MMQLESYKASEVPEVLEMCKGGNVHKASIVNCDRCTHKPRYRVCLAAALGMRNVLPATALPCEECSKSAARWRTSSATSSQGGASTRAPTICAEEDAISSWTSSSFIGNSSTTSSTSSLMRASSATGGEYCMFGDQFCPTPNRKFNQLDVSGGQRLFALAINQAASFVYEE